MNNTGIARRLRVALDANRLDFHPSRTMKTYMRPLGGRMALRANVQHSTFNTLSAGMFFWECGGLTPLLFCASFLPPFQMPQVRRLGLPGMQCRRILKAASSRRTPKNDSHDFIAN